MSIILKVLEGHHHHATVATLIGQIARAIDELLLREGKELSGFNKIGTLKGSNGRESPA